MYNNMAASRIAYLPVGFVPIINEIEWLVKYFVEIISEIYLQTLCEPYVCLNNYKHGDSAKRSFTCNMFWISICM